MKNSVIIRSLGCIVIISSLHGMHEIENIGEQLEVLQQKQTILNAKLDNAQFQNMTTHEAYQQLQKEYEVLKQNHDLLNLQCTQLKSTLLTQNIDASLQQAQQHHIQEQEKKLEQAIREYTQKLSDIQLIAQQSKACADEMAIFKEQEATFYLKQEELAKQIADFNTQKEQLNFSRQIHEQRQQTLLAQISTHATQVDRWNTYFETMHRQLPLIHAKYLCLSLGAAISWKYLNNPLLTLGLAYTTHALAQQSTQKNSTILYVIRDGLMATTISMMLTHKPDHYRGWTCLLTFIACDGIVHGIQYMKNQYTSPKVQESSVDTIIETLQKNTNPKSAPPLPDEIPSEEPSLASIYPYCIWGLKTCITHILNEYLFS